MHNFQELKTLLSEGQQIVITTHMNPDADALGSSVALAAYLQKIGCNPTIIVPNDYPKFLSWMVTDNHVINADKTADKKLITLINSADIIFCLDFNALSRIDILGDWVAQSNAYKVMIDHHLEPDQFSNAYLWSTQAAATAELVFEFIDTWMNDRKLIDPFTAEALYAGIMTDTGQFKHPNTTKNVHEVVSKLIDCGADVAKVARLIYDTNTEARLRFLGYILFEKLTILPEYKTAYMAITKEDLEKFDSKNGDTEGFVNYALSIDGVSLAVTLIEKDDKVKLSFRSQGDFSVNELARQHFNGGGHKNAAGGISSLSVEETLKKFLTLLPEFVEDLNKNTESNLNYAD